MGNCNASCLQPKSEDANMNLQATQSGSKTEHQQPKQGSNSQKNASKHSVDDANKKGPNSNVANRTLNSEEDEEDEFDDTAAVEAIKKKKLDRGHRTISAEAYGKYNKKGDFKAKVIPKTSEQKQRILARLEKAFMFSALDEKEKNIVIDAMVEKRFSAGEYVIVQDKTGDHLYVVDTGQLDCFKKFKPSPDDTYLKTYQPGESFGELALLYNCPRAASIKAKTESLLWELDRETFNNIVKDSAIKKRERYEDFLKNVKILEDMDPYERSKIADVLKTVKFKAGEYIIKQGEKGETFYFIEEGQAVATKKEGPNAPEKEVFNYTDGNFFGELALRNNAPRQASVVAKTNITLAVIDRESFKRVLGPIDALMEKQAKNYVGYNK